MITGQFLTVQRFSIQFSFGVMKNFCSAALLLVLVAGVAAFANPVAKICEFGPIIDITHKYKPKSPKFDSAEGMGPILSPYKGINHTENRHLNWASISLATNAGTHTKAYTTVEYLDLKTLNGPALVVDVPRDKNITAEVVECLNIPAGVERVLFKTLNSDRGLMYKKKFDSSYTGLTTDGAECLVKNSNIKLVGLDYLSVAIMPDREPVYQLLGKDIIPVEGLKLNDINPGEYVLRCLPLGVSDATETPTRCILIQ